MDFSAEAPEQKGKLLKNVGKIAVKALPVAAQFVPALKPVAAVVAAVKQ